MRQHWVREKYGPVGTKRQILSTRWQALAGHNTRRRWSVSPFVTWYKFGQESRDRGSVAEEATRPGSKSLRLRRCPPPPLAVGQGSAQRSGMSTALKMPSHRATVDEFLEWDSGDRTGALWQLRDGEPEMMPPAPGPTAPFRHVWPICSRHA